jgi:hypothetical protein
MRKPTKVEQILAGFRPDPRVLPGDAILTAADLEGLSKASNDELRCQIEEGRTGMNAMTAMPHDDWQRKGVNACQLMFARLLAGIVPEDEIEATERLISGMIDCGGWPFHVYDRKLIKLAIVGCGFSPDRPLKFGRGQDCAERTVS